LPLELGQQRRQRLLELPKQQAQLLDFLSRSGYLPNLN
jgi:hypothetical protein